MKILTVPVNPVAASRARVGRYGGYFLGTYKLFRGLMSAFKKKNAKAAEPIDEWLDVEVECYVKRPASTTRDYPKGDVDNYAKAVLDSLNLFLWSDDDKIVRLVVTKNWDEEGGTGRFVVRVNKYAQ